MPDPIDPKAFLNLVEMTIDSMDELEAIGELLEQRMVMAVILQHGLSADQATARLGRAIQLLEWGKQAA